MLPCTCYVFHRRFSLGRLSDGPACGAFPCNVSFGKLYAMVNYTRRTIRQFEANCNVDFHRGPQHVVSVCSGSYLVAVSCHNIPASLSLGRDNTYDIRVCWALVRLLYRICVATVRGSFHFYLIASKPAPSRNTYHDSAYYRLWHALEVISSICLSFSSVCRC